MLRLTHFFSLLVAICLAACSAPSPRLVATPVRHGMTNAQLLSQFGRPLHTQHHPDGSEDWFYQFGSQQRESRPTSEAAVSETERSYSVGHETTTTTTMRQAPIHLSPAGRVVGAIPTGNVVVQ